MNPESIHEIDVFVTSTSEIIYLQHDDSIIVIRPGKILHFDSTGFEMLDSLYRKKAGAERTIETMHMKYGTDKNIIIRNLTDIVKSLNALMNNEDIMTENIPETRYNPENNEYPVLAEISLTYRCQNRCDFCSTPASQRGREFNEMTTSQVKLLIDKIYSDIKIQSISFTGGEPSLRTDLAELIEYACGKEIRTHLATNGIKCSDNEFVKKLSAAGLHSARVNLESHDEIIHNRITGNMESFKKTVEGIHNLRNSGIHTTTSTTICRRNRDHLVPIVKFVIDEFNASHISMKMAIPQGREKDGGSIEYSSIPSILGPVLKYSEENGIKLIWNSPTPYCIFNPVNYQLGVNSCECVSGIFSINPAGDVIPCSGYGSSIGNLLNDSFQSIWISRKAVYFREKKFTPPVCSKCSSRILCAGGCPLYWENAGSFREIEKVNRRRPVIRNLIRSIENRSGAGFNSRP